jgi:hypothetical protein
VVPLAPLIHPSAWNLDFSEVRYLQATPKQHQR